MKFTLRILGHVVLDFEIDRSDDYGSWQEVEDDFFTDGDDGERPPVEFDCVEGEGDNAPVFYDCSTCLDRLVEVKERLSDEDEEALRIIHKEVCPGADPEPEPAK